MGLFKSKKPQSTNLVQSIPDECKVCELFQGSPNRYGTYVLSKFWLCTDKDSGMFTIDNKGLKFKIIEVSWNGKNIVSSTISYTDTTSDGKSKRTGRVLGTAIGTVVAPGIGTIVGAAHGTGNSKTSNNATSTTHTYEKSKEEVSDICLVVQYETGQEGELKYQCYEKQAHTILSIIGLSNNDDEAPHNSDPYEEIKRVKELLDMGIITQEEFDAKKKVLLGL